MKLFNLLVLLVFINWKKTLVSSEHSLVFCDKHYENKLIDGIFNIENTIYAFRKPFVWILKDFLWNKKIIPIRLTKLFKGNKSIKLLNSIKNITKLNVVIYFNGTIGVKIFFSIMKYNINLTYPILS
jgi:hypothetical protein